MRNSDKIYISQNYYTREFFLTPDYSRVEYYDHKELTYGMLPRPVQSDLVRFGFAVSARNRFDGVWNQVHHLWNQYPTVLGKPGKSLEEMQEEAYARAGYEYSLHSGWVPKAQARRENDAYGKAAM